GQAMGEINLTAVASEFKRLLGLDQNSPDPLEEQLRSIAARGRVGCAVTQLEIAPDLGAVTVESRLWVRAEGGQWIPQVSRVATVRPDDLRADAGHEIAADPQVQAAFGIVEGLGLGSIPVELKERSLRIGAATQRALDTGRSLFNQDLEALS